MTRYWMGLLLLAVLFASAVALVHTGAYGLTVFVVHPAMLGAVVSWTLQPKNGLTASLYGFLSVLVATGLLFLAGVDGFACAAISLPLTSPLGALGGWVAYRCGRSRILARGSLAMLLIVPPASLTWDKCAQSPVYGVTSSVTIAAPPSQVWNQIVSLSEFPEPTEWYFRAGMAYPTSVHLDGNGPGATRYCTFSTGQVVETIERWEPGRLLRFRVTQNPAPMREWTPYGEISPRHLHGYLISREGEFRLTPLPGNRTLLEGTSWYSHGLWPAPYWRLWSDAVIHRVHLRVFNRIKLLAETGARP